MSRLPLIIPQIIGGIYPLPFCQPPAPWMEGPVPPLPLALWYLAWGPMAGDGAEVVVTPKECGVFVPPTMALGEYLALEEGNRHCRWGDTLLLGGGWFVLGKRYQGDACSFGEDIWPLKGDAHLLGWVKGGCTATGRGLPFPWGGYRGLPSPWGVNIRG